MQRYRCVACRRSFNALTGTPLAYLRLRHKWLYMGWRRVLDAAALTLPEDWLRVAVASRKQPGRPT